MVDLTFPSYAEAGLKIVGKFLANLAIPVFPNSYFRGHASDKWELKCSAFRNGNVGIGSDLELDAWRKMARRFVPGGAHSNLEYLVLAQHFGIPTSLLDWTSNPLIALFFACEVDVAQQPGVVLQFVTVLSPIEEAERVALFNAHRRSPMAIDTSSMNIRSSAQDSMMTLHAPDEDDYEVIEAFKIAHDEKHLVTSALRLFGITPERVYADLGVAAEQFKHGLELNAAVRQDFMFIPGTEPDPHSDGPAGVSEERESGV